MNKGGYISLDPWPFGWIAGDRLLFNASRKGSIYMPLPPVIHQESEHTFSDKAIEQASLRIEKLGWPMRHKEVEA